MSRNKAKDDLLFNCSQEHEFDYVAGLYPNKQEVKTFLKEKCKNNKLQYSTHYAVYLLISNELGYTIPSCEREIV